MRNVNEFLAEMAANPELLGRFINDPEETLRHADLSEEDRRAVIGNFPTMMLARLAGYPIGMALVLPPPPIPPVWGWKPTNDPVTPVSAA